MLGILLVLAVFDLVVGVSNDAANFLNSALGCRAAKRRTVLLFAAVGVLAGAAFSGGMMEIARNGVFVPSMFSFRDIMLLFMAVMLTDVLLLDAFNTLGLPTSTTVSLVFELLGAGLGVAVAAVASGTGLSPDVADYIHGAKSLGIISGIFCSVAVAFTCGTAVMWFSRLLFSFRYQRGYRYLGALWCAVSMTAITWFAVFKGMKHSVLVSPDTLDFLSTHLPAATACVFVLWLTAALIAQHLLKINVLKVVVLCGTAALAFAFAGNDLVNFIGVFMAAEAACETAAATAAAGGNIDTLYMGVLAEPVKAETAYLLIAGLIMVGALCFSRKAQRVTDTEIKLAHSKRSHKERFGSCLPARLLVRHTLHVAEFVGRCVPAPVTRWVNSRFEPVEQESAAAYDLIRGSVNLTVSALLISLATSLKLPLSTTYVTFMVAMGSALADRAWGRESAVYRITGVLTVIGGWFMTAVAACTAAFLVATLMVHGGMAAVIIMVLCALGVLVKSALRRGHEETESLADSLETAADVRLYTRRLGLLTAQMLAMHTEGVKALVADDAATLKRLRRDAKQLRRRLEDERDELLQRLQELPSALAEDGQRLFRAVTGAHTMSVHLQTQMKAAYRHAADFQGALSAQQGEELLGLTAEAAALFSRMKEQHDPAAAQQKRVQLNERFTDILTRHLMHHAESDRELRHSLLFLTLLNETRAMVMQAVKQGADA